MKTTSFLSVRWTFSKSVESRAFEISLVVEEVGSEGVQPLEGLSQLLFRDGERFVGSMEVERVLENIASPYQLLLGRFLDVQFAQDPFREGEEPVDPVEVP